MSNKMIINSDVTKGTISKHIYGHFSEHLGRCIYEGIWVGEDSAIPNTKGIRNDVLEALKNLNIPVLRWPGGCFADEYHWKDGIGPREQRKRMVNTHWGGVVENNHFGTHEFMMLCDMLGCEPYIAGNVGSGTVHEMQEWVEYLTFDGESPMANWRKENGREEPWRLKYFGVGNENWGCGGNMRPEYYADVYRRYQTYVRDYGENRIYRVACGSHDAHTHWTEVLMREAAHLMEGLSLHYYVITGPSWQEKGSATDFTEQEWFTTMQKALKMDEVIKKHGAIMDKYDPDKRVGLIIDEWGTWFDVEPGTNPGFLYQQNTLRDALVASTTFDIFHNHCDRVHMANIAQTVNVLQAVVLTEGEKMLLTPTYHVFEMYKVHQDAELLDLHIQSESYTSGEESIPQISGTASSKDGVINIGLSNLSHDQSAEVQVELRGLERLGEVSGRILTSANKSDHNTFDRPGHVQPTAFSDFSVGEGQLRVMMPPMSVVTLELK